VTRPLSALEGEIARLKMVITSQRGIFNSISQQISESREKGHPDKDLYRQLMIRQDKVSTQLATAEYELKKLGAEVPTEPFTRDPDAKVEMVKMPDWLPPGIPADVPELELRRAERKHLEDLKKKNYAEMGKAYEEEDTLLGDAIKTKILDLDKDIKKLDMRIEKLVDSPVSLPRPTTSPRARVAHRWR